MHVQERQVHVSCKEMASIPRLADRPKRHNPAKPGAQVLPQKLHPRNLCKALLVQVAQAPNCLHSVQRSTSTRCLPGP